MKRAIVFVALVACDPVFTVRGSVREACVPEPKPLADASMTLHCPLDQPVALGKTNAEGRIETRTLGILDPACFVRFEKDGFRARDIAVGDLCPSFVSGHCSFVFANAELVRDTPKAAP